MTIWTDSTLIPIGDNEGYSAPDGTHYLAAWPKSDIEGLMVVAETPRPDETATGNVNGEARGGVDITGWHIELVKGKPIQVWDTTARPQMTPTEAAAAGAAALKIGAQDALDKSDITVMRCVEAGMALPPEWVTYRRALRDVIAGKSAGPLPARPAYPAGS